MHKHFYVFFNHFGIYKQSLQTHFKTLYFTDDSHTARKMMERGVTNVLEGLWWLLEMLVIFFSQYWSSATFRDTYMFLEQNCKESMPL